MREILQTPTFSKQAKKLRPNQREALEEAIRTIAASPSLGKAKKADLRGVHVYKFKMVHQLTLLAYQYTTEQLLLLALGSHENFYRDLKKR
ncbi:MAG: type II toxin-antitoxin system RelE/ParE family toxin [Bacteroidota bacterium]